MTQLPTDPRLARLRRELTVETPIGRGKSAGAKLVQEYLNLHGIKVVVDGDFGPATERGVTTFAPGQRVVDQALMLRLASPILRATERREMPPALGAAIVAVAKQHLASHPIEVGGQNSGPWVRLYMDGNEGPSWPWCMGFATWVVRQAADAIGVPVPEHLKRTYSCDVVGAAARKTGNLLAPDDRRVTPGCLFLVPGRAPNDWVHTGIVVSVSAETVVTIEGNTNSAGSREGFEVCERIRRRNSLEYAEP